MMLLILLIAFALVFAAGILFGLWLAGLLDAAPIIEDFDDYCAGCGAKEAGGR